MVNSVVPAPAVNLTPLGLWAPLVAMYESLLYVQFTFPQVCPHFSSDTGFCVTEFLFSSSLACNNNEPRYLMLEESVGSAMGHGSRWIAQDNPLTAIVDQVLEEFLQMLHTPALLLRSNLDVFPQPPCQLFHCEEEVRVGISISTNLNEHTVPGMFHCDLVRRTPCI